MEEYKYLIQIVVMFFLGAFTTACIQILYNSWKEGREEDDRDIIKEINEARKEARKESNYRDFCDKILKN